jgi:LCP family protein required for cell wall assembly
MPVWLKIVTGILSLAMIGALAFAGFWFVRLQSNISKAPLNAGGGSTDAAVNDSTGRMQILILGSDTRDGLNGDYGTSDDSNGYGKSDVMMLMDISEDNKRVSVISFPRDLLVDIPECKDEKTRQTYPARRGVMINEAMGEAGIGCAVDTVNKLTGLKVDHFMMADFNAVKELTTAVGGVEVCTAKNINDPKSHLNLTAGKHVVKGEKALAFVRTRHSVGFGSDLDRIKLQQQFLSSMIRKMKSAGTLTNPSKLFDLANAATKALTVDTGIGSVKKLADLAKDLQRVEPKNITFATVPVLDNPEDPATVILDEAKSQPLFKMVRADKSLTKTKKGSKGGGPSKKKAPVSQVRVDVFNGGGPVGAAQETVDWMQNQKGVGLSTNAGNAASQLTKTRLEFTPDQAGQAATVAEMMGLPKSALKENPSIGKSMELTLGKDFTQAGEPIAAPEKAPDGVQNVKADDKKICAK